MKQSLFFPIVIATVIVLLSLLPRMVHAQTNLSMIKLRGWSFYRQTTLVWSEEDDGTNTAAGFIIERGGAASNNFAVVATTGGFVTNFAYDAPLGPWCYRVSAYNDAGTSAPSNIACSP